MQKNYIDILNFIMQRIFSLEKLFTFDDLTETVLSIGLDSDLP